MKVSMKFMMISVVLCGGLSLEAKAQKAQDPLGLLKKAAHDDLNKDINAIVEFSKQQAVLAAAEGHAREIADLRGAHGNELNEARADVLKVCTAIGNSGKAVSNLKNHELLNICCSFKEEFANQPAGAIVCGK